MKKAVDSIKSTKPFEQLQQAVLFFWSKTVPQAMSFREMTVIRRGDIYFTGKNKSFN